MATLATGGAETREAAVQDDGSFSAPGGDNGHNWRLQQAKKAEFIREAEKLRQQIALLEKDKSAHLYNKKNDFRIEYSMLEEYEQKLTNSRKAGKVKTEQQLSRIHNNVRRLQLQLKDVRPTPEFVEKLREMMEEVDNAVTGFKEEQRIIYEELMKEEKTTVIELNALEKKIEASFSTVSEKSLKAPSSKAQLDTMADSQLPEDVVAFERFLQQTGGRLGGWDDFDHQSFLKVWTKHKGKPSYLEEALAYLPSRTREDIQQHETWYNEFLFLEEKKKESIQKWKARKLQEKMEMTKVHEKTRDISEFDQQQQEEAHRQNMEERKKRQRELEAWKRQKEIEAAAKLEAKLKEEEEHQRKQRKERQRQLEVKLIVEEHARIKKEQEEFLRLEKEIREEAEREERKRMASYEICRFQERDQQKLEEKSQEKKVKEEAEKEQERRLAKLKEKVQVHVERDPSRLCKLTKGWEERCKNIGPTGSAPLLQIPHRAVPTWRQGL
ncbi:coiled-coil domain-containing protein 112 isoform X2 [Hyla sarda]|uniref:coiled-coil domain-containing protein 112 isoform X2 n=1 Tax=Hyla sarda TaxID=327740 RepID=UPI0024C3094A|nr:coiled-coil domain-containing protein 112 isoform X2 [Hyla sarda]